MTGAELIAEELPANVPEAHSKALSNASQALRAAGEGLCAELDAVRQHQNTELSAEE